MIRDPSSSVDLAQQWLRLDALPFCIAHAVDRQGAGFVERFDWSGNPIDPGFRRVRVTGRQIYVFAHAALGGLDKASDRAIAGSEFLISRGVRPDGQFVSRLTSDGSVLDAAADLYDIAFGLFAMAWWYHLTGDRVPVDVAERSVLHLKSSMRHPCGLGFLSREDAPETYDQNPHMHLFEAAIFLSEMTGRQIFSDLADELFKLAFERLFDHETGTLSEHFGAAWVQLEPTPVRRVEPGHHYEWTWLLLRYADLTGEARAREMASRLFEFAFTYGHDAETGLILDAVDPFGNLLADDCRIWPNTEYLKALVAMREAFGASITTSDAVIEAAVDRLTRHFLRPPGEGPAAKLRSGLWIDYLARDGKSLRCDHVPASTLYHVMFGFSEVFRFQSGHSPRAFRPW